MPKEDETKTDQELEEGQEPEKETTDEDEFDTAFEEAISEDEPQKKDSATEDDDGEPKAESDTDTPTEDDDGDGSDSDGDSEGSQEEVDWVSKFKEIEEENLKLTHKMKSWEGRITAANKRAEEAEQKLQTATQKSTQDKDSLPVGDDEDEQVLKDFVDEFPSLEKPIKTIAMRLAKKVVDSKLKELEPQLQRIQGLEQAVTETAEEKHWNMIATAHADWKEIRDSGKLSQWIEAQPSFMRKSLEQVAAEGSAEEVVEMFDMYKESIGESKSTSTQRGSESPPKKKKVQDMSAVDGSSGGPPKRKGKVDKDDFDGAWNEALRSE